ncbi:MAG: fibro-slime domain-containing protein, partial [Lachnospiraceae bacterium]|nr:fibro-slime domain-containing protein [Lachnospiraceae bacterium]
MVTQKNKTKQLIAFIMSVVLLVISGLGMSKSFRTYAYNEVQLDKTDASLSGIPANLSPVYNKDTNEQMYVAKSTFYDYYSDSQVGSGDQPKAIDDGVYGTDNRATENSFTKFNNVLLNTKNYADVNKTAAKYPMYLGLFFSNQADKDNGGFYYNNSNDANIAKNFYLGANSSQQGGGKEGAVTDINTATQGLVDNKLDANGNITQTNGNNKDLLPFFDKEYLTNTKFENSSLSLAKINENVSFPFRKTDKSGVTYYEFDSRKDTVRFNSEGQLDYLGINKEQVYDQKKEEGVSVKPGFFPYNSPADSDSTRLNYGFGTKIEIPFNMTVDGKVNGQDIVFEFSGDDDVWVFIDGYLALDIGGGHSRVEGKINFADLASTVSGVKNNTVAFAQRNWWFVENRNYSSNDNGLNDVLNQGETVPGIYKNKTDAFVNELKESLKDTEKVHTLTFFYMERGKIESNMMINFNLPEPNQLQVNKTVDYSDVNAALLNQTKVLADKEEFQFQVIDKDLKIENNVTLSNG